MYHTAPHLLDPDVRGEADWAIRGAPTGFATVTARKGHHVTSADDSAHDLGPDPSNAATSGVGRARKRPALSSHVPIRFSPDTVAAVKMLADADGVSVSTWVRNLVARELRARMPAHSVSGTSPIHLEISGLPEGSRTEGTRTELVGVL